MRNQFSDASDPRSARTVSLIRLGALFLITASALAIATPALAEHTRWWRQSSFEDFDKGTAK